LKVYIFRHGHSETKAESPTRTDAGRRLLDEGRDQVNWTCARAREFGTVPTVVMSSPRARAQETALISKRLLNPRAELKTDSCLEPEAKVKDVYSALSKLKKSDSVVLVTHLPLLGRLFADLLDWGAVWHNLDFESGSMARIDSKTLPRSKSGNLIWLVSPARSS
jgi:phosphohistidine phosphatase